MRSKRLKHLADIRVSTVDKKSLDGQTPVALCNYTDVYYNDRIVADLPFMVATATAEQIAKFTLHAGDVLITKDSETADDIAVPAYVPTDLPGVLSGYHLAALRPRSELLDGRYLYWALSSRPVKDQFTLAASGVTRFGLRHEAIGSAQIPLPSISEQRAIAADLDRETAEIDTLADRKSRLIELLHQRRAALSRDLVSGGLMDAPRSSTGLAWIPTVPQHWDVVRLGARYEVQLGKMLDEAAATGLHPAPYLRNVNVQWDHIDETDLKVMDFDADDRRRYALQAGDLLVCEGGEVGRAAVWDGESGSCFYQKALHRVRPRTERDISRFLMHVLSVSAGIGVFRAEGNKSTIVHLTAEKLRAHRFPFPPREEQLQIVERIDAGLAHLNRLQRDLHSQIELLRERRAALVTQAVTGGSASSSQLVTGP